MGRDKTIGEISLESTQKELPTRRVQELSEDLSQEYMKNLLGAIDAGYKIYPKDFFVVVETKAEPLLPNVFRNYFIHRWTCPTPNYDQSVFRYDRDKGEVQYIWTIPSRDTCHHLKDNALLIHKDEKWLLDFILAFDDGTLFKLMKKLNNEKEETPEMKDV